MKTIAQLIPYAPFPPRGGGALRCVNIAKQLARFYETKLLVIETSQSALERGPEVLPGVEFFSTLEAPREKDLFDFIPKGAGLRYRWLRRKWAGPSNSIVGETHQAIRRLFTTRNIDAIVLEHLDSLAVVPLIKRLSSNTKIIFDAHNVDHWLMRQERESQISAGTCSAQEWRTRYQHVEKREKNLGRNADAFWACSDLDRSILENLNAGLRGYTIHNGIDCGAMTFRNETDVNNATETILFCGSLGYEANRDGLTWFARECWPSIKAGLPKVRLCVIGRGGLQSDYELLISDPNVDFIGEVDSTLPFYQEATISICPLRIGSGTRLKILETLSIGTPSVSTPLGCEGIDVLDGEHVLLASEADDFAAQCVRLIQDKTLAASLSVRGRKLVEEKFDWQIIGEAMRNSIEEICQSSSRVV